MITKESIEYQVYTDVWRLFRKNYDALSLDGSDTAWVTLMEEANELHERYSGNDMCENFILAAVKTLESQFSKKE